MTIDCMTPDEILEYLSEWLDDEEFPTQFPTLKDALIGYAEVWSTEGRQPVRLVYCASKCLDIFMERDGMSPQDAREWLYTNTQGSYLGPQTPIILHRERHT